MKDYLQLWFEHLRDRPKGTVASCIEITGEYDKHNGPAWPRAAVRLTIEPADTFELVDEVKISDDDRAAFDHPDYIMIGLLSVLMTARWQPLLNIKVTLKEVKIDPVETSRAAFEMAGRDAGHKLIAAMKR